MLTYVLELFVFQLDEAHGISDKTEQMYKRHYCGVSVHDFTEVVYNWYVKLQTLMFYCTNAISHLK